MAIRDDIAESFKAKGLTFVSLNESTVNPQGSTLLYKDSGGKLMSREIAIRLSELEDTVSAIDVLDPEDLANFLLK